MHDVYDYKKFAVLYVDDEERSLKYFARAFQDQFRILTASSAQDGLRVLEEQKDDIAVLITDQRMPGEKGTWLLEKARQLRPRIVRILATAFSDMDAAVAAVNTGAIYKYVTKPWDPPQLDATLKRAMEFFIVQRERDQLLKEKLATLHNMMIADRMMSLGLLAAGLSHHIRNSLVAVKTFLDLAPSKLKEENLDVTSLRNPDFWKEYYQNAQGQIEKINNMLKDLWAVSEPPTVQFRDEVRLETVLRDVVEGLRDLFAAKNIKINIQVPQDLPALVVDQPKFERLFELLLRDEAVSLPAGCEVHVTARTVHTEGTPAMAVEIHDNGPGLPKEALRLIFDPFVVRTDTPLEYGINLMAAYFIVHHHGGRIEARSEAGQGTTFALWLPVNPNHAALVSQSGEFLQKLLINESVWEKMLASS
jgi:two-component system, probable response regulator PhcQ